MSLDEHALIEYVTQQRWYGAKSRAVAHAQVLDSVVAAHDRAAARARARRDALRHRRARHLPAALRAARRRAQIDGLDEPQLARELVSAMRSRPDAAGRRGHRRVPRRSRASPALGRELLDARPVGAEQSNTSIVFDDELILKVFRRLEPGINPELEMLRFLTEHGFANIAPLGGWYAYSGGPLERDARDPAGVRARRASTAGSSRSTRSASAPDAFLDAAAAARRGDGRDAHDARLRPDRSRVLRPRRRASRRSALLTATVDEEIERVFLDLPEDDERLAPILGRGEEVREQLRLLTPRRLAGQVDPHARRLPPRPDALGGRRLGDPRLRGRAGAVAHRAAPQALAAARRRRDAALVRVRRDRRASCCAARRRRRAGRSRRASSSSTATSRRSTRRCCPSGAGGDRAAARGVRAREGGLRAALRARQPARLGRHPRRGDPAADRAGGRDADDRARRRTRTASLGAHEAKGGVVVRAYRPEARRRARRSRPASRRS